MNIFQDETIQKQKIKSSSVDKLLSTSDPLKNAVEKAKKDAEINVIAQALTLYSGNHTKAAKKLNISRSYLHRKIKQYAIST